MPLPVVELLSSTEMQSIRSEAKKNIVTVIAIAAFVLCMAGVISLFTEFGIEAPIMFGAFGCIVIVITLYDRVRDLKETHKIVEMGIVSAKTVADSDAIKGRTSNRSPRYYITIEDNVPFEVDLKTYDTVHKDNDVTVERTKRAGTVFNVVIHNQPSIKPYASSTDIPSRSQRPESWSSRSITYTEEFDGPNSREARWPLAKELFRSLLLRLPAAYVLPIIAGFFVLLVPYQLLHYVPIALSILTTISTIFILLYPAKLLLDIFWPSIRYRHVCITDITRVVPRNDANPVDATTWIHTDNGSVTWPKDLALPDIGDYIMLITGRFSKKVVAVRP